MEFNRLEPWKTLDPWQIEYIAEKSNCFLLCARQTGKSTAMSIKAAKRALENANRDILVIALTERQAYELFFKILNYLEINFNDSIRRGNFAPTKHEINLKNGSVIRCHPTGLTGAGLRTYTITDLFVDEGARINQEVFDAVIPMLAVTHGTIDIGSTPCGKQGFFHSCSQRDDFKKFYVSGEDCLRISKEHIEIQKKNMSGFMYAQEYLAVFIDDLRRLYGDELLKKCCVSKRYDTIMHNQTYMMGVDVARMGEDLSTFEIIKLLENGYIEQVESLITKKTFTTETVTKIINLDREYDFKLIGLDDSGLGVAVYDPLLKEDSVKRKVRALNNASRSLDTEDEKKKKLLREDMYLNLLNVMEQGKIKLLLDDEVIDSLKTIQFEYLMKEGQITKMRVAGSNSHVAEGLIRAVWLATQEKDLNLKVYSIKV